jgi:hypothetical protein
MSGTNLGADRDRSSELSFGSDQFADLAKEILDKGRSLRFRARGLSMRPTIRDGDLLEIQPIAASAETGLAKTGFAETCFTETCFTETCFGHIHLGDILLYQYYGQTVNPDRNEGRQLLVHRVVRKKKVGDQPMLLIQGDAVLQPDGWVDPRQVLGRVSRIERAGSQPVSTTFRLDTAGMKVWAFCLALSFPMLKRIYARLKRLLLQIYHYRK